MIKYAQARAASGNSLNHAIVALLMDSQIEPRHERRVSSYGCAMLASMNYFESTMDLEEFHNTDESRESGRYDLNDINERLELLHERCLELGFCSVFEAALADAR